ncbi:hypothetical protein TNIN_165641 [Trichonephila inaurata madagascariensis]|uniref:Uncharacterized protein n=1 Tax=Trichonephila inaurata madagascariensis TaxID=2747483 RepID=A0A8X6YEC0_9ARAC|nr:hypothetical protein TNIN_165641 [Trichonephila inaurata madagascariensis]
MNELDLNVESISGALLQIKVCAFFIFRNLNSSSSSIQQRKTKKSNVVKPISRPCYTYITKACSIQPALRRQRKDSRSLWRIQLLTRKDW